MKEKLYIKKYMDVKISSNEKGFNSLKKYFLEKGYSIQEKETTVYLHTDNNKFKIILNDMPKLCLKAGALIIEGKIYTDQENQTYFKYCVNVKGIYFADATTTSQEKLLC